jgi:hypothetical protein
MKVSKHERSVLEHLFVHQIALKGVTNRVVGTRIKTNSTHTRHHDLCSLERKKLLTFERDPLFSRFFGCEGWDVEATELAVKLLEGSP